MPPPPPYILCVIRTRRAKTTFASFVHSNRIDLSISNKKKTPKMNKTKNSDGESCCTDYETDGFWSSEKTLLQSVRGDDGVRKRKKKKKKPAAKERCGSDRDPVGAGLAGQWRLFRKEHDKEWRSFWRMARKCFVDTVVLVLMCGVGGLVFRYTEGAFETFYKCGVKRVKRDFLNGLWTDSRRMGEDQWKQIARRKLVEFEEQLHDAFEAGTTTYSGRSSWSFVNSAIYSFTVVTTIGYGHIVPSTNTGRLITIVYAIFGIPIFLILLADFGKMFTRGIKFLWAFVRRLYYTGSCRKVRRTAPVQEVMKGVQMVYDITKFRRPSAVFDGIPDSQSGYPPTSPSTPALSTYAIDDEFNLPISVAFVILLIYIVFGAMVFWFEEGWGFFQAFYFVFISMSTIGFGDFVPKNQLVMIISIVYLVFGLALTSMCINVVQEKLQNSFRQATAKISATIGLGMPMDEKAVTDEEITSYVDDETKNDSNK
ncbi:TWiK family of potassium channels protein 7-like isoform X1 [Adelges cooleyi]|uniref:TWiK family of potassium channels protein 7-like isoform X1 n=1 Tax=Adelges cooleyi TaxID=133065 RepID=UPI00217F5A42|nr:TWiK family of potassium channels protein 7-like isoform X1 [Adelges cooleyi]